MKKTKIVQLLQKLSEGEGLALRLYLQSPYFNQDARALALFEALYRYAPDQWSVLPEKLAFFRKEWPTERWDNKKTDYLMSQLNKLAEHFLAIEQVQGQAALLDIYLLDALSQKGLRKAFRQIQQQWIRQQAKQALHDKHGFFLQLRFEQIQEADFGRTRQRKDDRTIERHTQSLDRYYYASRLSLACNMLDRQAILNTQYEIQLTDDWLVHLRQYRFFEEPLIEMYYTIYQALLHEADESHFRQLKTHLQANTVVLSLAALSEIYLLTINYCARKIRSGKTEYIQEAFAIYKAGIQNRALYQEGYLSPWTFTNVVKLSLRLRDYSWTESFIEQYQDQLPPEFRENAVQYNRADLYYYTTRFAEAQEALSKVEYTDPNFYLGARELLAKIYYETGEEESLLSMIASFTMFLKRNKKLANNLKQPYLNFCRLLLKIVRRSRRDLATLEQELAETPLLASRAWLQKIEREAKA
ncbi:MAG TPA: hypothetical protein VJ953_18965 [Saprospiraceae bacterium]|nr:hypothetical protein [Saprospiraceae bacterium]